MDDELEKFIIENRKDFDDATLSENNWSKIEKKLKKSSSPWSKVWKAAAVIFMISTLSLIIDRNKPSVEEYAFLSDEFIQVENYYTFLISEKRQLIKEQITPEEQKQFLEEINQLDTLYLELKQLHQINASNDRVVDAMISNLQFIVHVLNRQLDILQTINNQNNEKKLSFTL